jgi:hypothetical protein
MLGVEGLEPSQFNESTDFQCLLFKKQKTLDSLFILFFTRIYRAPTLRYSLGGQ